MTFEPQAVNEFLKEQQMKQDPRAWILEVIDSEMSGTGSAQDDRDAAKVADTIADYIKTLQTRIRELEQG